MFLSFSQLKKNFGYPQPKVCMHGFWSPILWYLEGFSIWLPSDWEIWTPVIAIAAYMIPWPSGWFLIRFDFCFGSVLFGCWVSSIGCGRAGLHNSLKLKGYMSHVTASRYLGSNRLCWVSFAFAFLALLSCCYLKPHLLLVLLCLHTSSMSRHVTTYNSFATCWRMCWTSTLPIPGLSLSARM